MIETFVEVALAKEEDFLKVKETLTRIGIASRKENKLWQSCHILHKKQKFYIVHFKELFALDGKSTDFSEEDRGRRNTIASLLEEWELVKIVNPEVCKEPRAPLSHIKIITFKDKENWELESKYTIGRKF
jgi:hypothetical protein